MTPTFFFDFFQLPWKGANVGKINGLSLLLDAESFDYSYPLEVPKKFVHHIFHQLSVLADGGGIQGVDSSSIGPTNDRPPGDLNS